MEPRGLLTFLVALLLLIVSSWTAATFLRLQKVSKQYAVNEVFTSACQFSTMEVKTGVTAGFVAVVLSLALVIVSGISLYYSA
jgi:hypothetical protein